MIAHALCTIGNVRFGKKLDASKAALIGLYHDASEIITGDMPTPVKYYNSDIKDAYKKVEHVAEEKLLMKLPDDLRDEYKEIFLFDEEGYASEEEKTNEQYMRKLVKAADKLSAYIKCVEEENSGNREFRTAKSTISEGITEMSNELPEVKEFMKDFLDSYGKTLDELTL